MKIAYLLRFWPVYGGGETVTRLLANELVRRNHEVTIIYLWDRDNQTVVEVEDRVKEIRLANISNIKDGNIKRSEFHILYNQLETIFQEKQFDVIINQWLPSKLVYRASLGTNSKVIKCHHGVVKYVPIIKTLKQKVFYGILGEKGGWLRVYWQRREDYTYSDKWVFLSESFVEDAKKLLKLSDSGKLCSIPNPIIYHSNQEPINLDCKEHKVIYVGRMIELKRVHFLLDAWRRIEDNQNMKDWSFTLIGDGITLDDEIAYAKEIGCQRANFIGFQDPTPYYVTSSILTLASNSEGFGMVLVEAQKYGCVPIALDSFSAVHDIIRNGQNGILVPDNDLEGYCNEMTKLMQNTKQRKELAKQGIIDSENFSVERIVDRWEQLFEEVIG